MKGNVRDRHIGGAQMCAILSRCIQDNIPLIRYNLEGINSKSGQLGQ